MSRLANRQLQAVQERMLADIRRGALKVTIWAAIAIVVLVPATRLAFQQWSQTLTPVAALLTAIAISWGQYFLTKYRMRKGYFGGNAVEAIETLAFLNRDQCEKL